MRSRNVLIGLAILGFSTSHIFAAHPIRTVALSGHRPADLPPNAFIGGGGTPVINSAGQVAFAAPYTVIDQSGGREFLGIWFEGPGGLSLIASQGQTAPGTSGRTFTDLTASYPLAAENGAAVFTGKLSGLPADLGVFSTRSGDLEAVAVTQQQAPGTIESFIEIPTGYPGGARGPVTDGTGGVTFRATLTGASGANLGIWSNTSGALSMLARTGDDVPGLFHGITLTSLGYPVVNRTGAAAFRASWQGPGIDATNNSGVLSNASGVLLPAVQAGQSAPGAGEGVRFAAFNDPKINAAGSLAVTASLAGAVDSSNDSGLWVREAGQMRLVAREGQAAPGTPDGTVFSSLYDPNNMQSVHPGINNNGYVTFLARLNGPGVDTRNSRGFWKESADGLSLLARWGDPAPGFPSGYVIKGITSAATNNSGASIVFGTCSYQWSMLEKDAIWAAGSNGVLELILASGLPLEVSPGEFLTIARLGVHPSSPGNDGQASVFNDAGQLAFWASFTNGMSGTFVVTIPEPASSLLILVAGAILGRRRLRQGSRES